MKKNLFTASVFAGFLLLSACSSDMTSEEHLARAAAFMAEGDYPAAQIALKNAAVKDPRSVTARYELAKLAQLQGDWAAAEKEARRAIELGVAGDVYVRLIEARYMQEQYEGVIDETADLTDMPDGALRADIMGYRALAQMELRQYRDAEASVEAGLELAADSSVALLARSIYEQGVGSRETALELAQSVVEQEPGFALALIQLGELKQQNADLKGAMDMYTRAVDAQSFVSLASARRAYIAARLGNMDLARSDLAALDTSAYKEHPDATFTRGFVAFLDGSYDTAAQNLMHSISMGDPTPLAVLYLASAFVQNGNLEQARQVVNQLHRVLPESVEVNRLMASIEIQQGDIQAARERIAALPQSGETDQIALEMLGTMALMEGDGDAAVEYFEKLVSLAPESAEARRLLQRAMTMRGDFVGDLSAMAEGGFSREDYGRALVSAASAYEQGQLEEAFGIAQNLQRQFPDKVDPLNLLGAMHLASGDVEQGREYFTRALLVDPENSSATRGLARIYLANGEEERALRMISEYVKNHPDDRAAIGIKANAILLTQDFAEAERRLTQLTQGVNNNIVARAFLVRLYFDNGKYEQVLFTTENLTREEMLAQPSLVELRGKSLSRLGRLEDAGKTWERWLSNFPDSVLANYYHGLYLQGAGQQEEALEYFKKSRDLNPGYLPVRLELVRFHARAGDSERAFRELEQLKSELREERGQVWLTEAWMHVQVGAYDAAAGAARRSLELEPAPDAVVLLFVSLNTEGRGEEGVEVMETWLKEFPAEQTLLSMLARTYLERGENERAVGLYKRMLAVRPDSVEALNNLAWVLKDSDLEQAVTYAQLALEVAPDDPQVLDTVAALRAKGGRF